MNVTHTSYEDDRLMIVQRHAFLKRVVGGILLCAAVVAPIQVALNMTPSVEALLCGIFFAGVFGVAGSFMAFWKTRTTLDRNRMIVSRSVFIVVKVSESVWIARNVPRFLVETETDDDSSWHAVYMDVSDGHSKIEVAKLSNERDALALSERMQGFWRLG